MAGFVVYCVGVANAFHLPLCRYRSSEGQRGNSFKLRYSVILILILAPSGKS